MPKSHLGWSAGWPTGIWKSAARRAGFRFRAPTLGEHNDEVLSQAQSVLSRLNLPGRTLACAAPVRPLDGLRVLDLGVIVVGAETGRLLADQGAEVIKVENRTFMDGARQADTPRNGSATPSRSETETS